MRLWSIHPKYLDQKGLVACWREALLAQECLLCWKTGGYMGYVNHAQLLRFKQTGESISAIGEYLYHLWEEADKRNYNFNYKKIIAYDKTRDRLSVTIKQVLLEMDILIRKLEFRNQQKMREVLENIGYVDTTKDPDADNIVWRTGGSSIDVHPLFKVIPGEVESWEKAKLPSNLKFLS